MVVVRIIFISFLLILILPTIQGRGLFMERHDNSSSTQEEEEKGKEKKSRVVKEGRGEIQIGSRPPSCERRISCKSCGQCQPIQVPTTFSYSLVSDIIDYKPTTWKCKCGSSLFNP